MLSLLLLAASFAGHAPVWVGCEHAGRTRPTAVVIACADANLSADHLRWTSWTASSAKATGTGHENDCKPYCAAGHFHAYPISIRLSKPVTCHGRREFTRIAWTWATKPPPTPNGSETLPCR